MSHHSWMMVFFLAMLITGSRALIPWVFTVFTCIIPAWSLECLQVPLVLFLSVTWGRVHWPLAGVAPWLRAPRSLDEARGMKPSKAPRVETYPYGPIPKKLDDDLEEEDEHPGKKKKDLGILLEMNKCVFLFLPNCLKFTVEWSSWRCWFYYSSMDCGVSSGILVWSWAVALVFYGDEITWDLLNFFLDVSCMAQRRTRGANKERYRIFSDASVSWHQKK